MRTGALSVFVVVAIFTIGCGKQESDIPQAATNGEVAENDDSAKPLSHPVADVRREQSIDIAGLGETIDNVAASEDSDPFEVSVDPIESVNIGAAELQKQVPNIGVEPSEETRASTIDQRGVIVVQPKQPGRAALVRQYGGTEESEAAVARAIAWIAAHQSPDGGWSFDHRETACEGRCGNHGTLGDARIAATALALLPMLGAGHTHWEGDYKSTVGQGLHFLYKKGIEAEGNLADEAGGNFSHALATLAFCEALRRTNDPNLQSVGQAAIEEIAAAQDTTGGWRSTPGGIVEFPVSVLQLMALNTAHRSKLLVSPQTVRKAVGYFDAQQEQDGVRYWHLESPDQPTWTAAGILGRFHMGWQPSHPAVEPAIAYLEKVTPTRGSDPLFNFVAAQVFFQNGGKPWQRFNARIRDHLIAMQAKDGHTSGSWYFDREDTFDCEQLLVEYGGRLYTTAMAALTLQVYYGAPRAVRDDKQNDPEFPLD